MRWTLVRREGRIWIWLRDEGGDGVGFKEFQVRSGLALRITAPNQLRTEDIVVTCNCIHFLELLLFRCVRTMFS